MSKQSNIFDIIILNGRPAAGKSEVIDFLKKTPLSERIERFHVGEFVEIDDFPILWERFEDDDIYERHGRERQISNTHFDYNGETLPGYTFKDKFFWNFLIEKLNLSYSKMLRDSENLHDNKTIIIEFSRGKEHGGFEMAYNYLSSEILKKACTVYIDVSFEESMRKNRRRFNPDKPDSILQHALEDKKLEVLYKESDWKEFSSKDPIYLMTKDHKVPYVTFQNEPEITDKEDKLAAHLQEITSKLWEVWSTR